MERGADGKRSFLVSTYAAFWARYQGMLPQHRHYYEIMRHGWPCHLYFGMPTSAPSHSCPLCKPSIVHAHLIIVAAWPGTKECSVCNRTFFHSVYRLSSWQSIKVVQRQEKITSCQLCRS